MRETHPKVYSPCTRGCYQEMLGDAAKGLDRLTARRAADAGACNRPGTGIPSAGRASTPTACLGLEGGTPGEAKPGFRESGLPYPNALDVDEFPEAEVA